jgi:Activator of Hsp90 ATPase homolog 1-like protein
MSNASIRQETARWDPPRVLAYAWGESRGGESEVTFELTPRGKDVALVITHRRLADRLPE